MVLAVVSTSDTTGEESNSLREQRSTAGEEFEVLGQDQGSKHVLRVFQALQLLQKPQGCGWRSRRMLK